MKKEWMHNNIKGQYGNYYLFNIPIIFLLWSLNLRWMREYFINISSLLDKKKSGTKL